MNSFKREVEELVEKHKKEVFEHALAKLYNKEDLTEEDILLLFECLRNIKKIEDSNEQQKCTIELLGAMNYYLSNEGIDKKSTMYVSILYGEINSLNSTIKLNNKYLLDLGISKEYDFFFNLLKCLLDSGTGIRTKELTSKLNITYDELTTFYFFQESINYVSRLRDYFEGIKEQNYSYYITLRGIEAYKNLCEEMNVTKRATEEYNKYYNQHSYEDVSYVESSENIKQYGGIKNNE